MSASDSGARPTNADANGSIYPQPQPPLSIQEVVYHLKSGRTVAGEPVRPYKWLDFAGGERSTMELRISRVMESCSFKSTLSCVLGVHIGITTEVVMSLIQTTIL